MSSCQLRPMSCRHLVDDLRANSLILVLRSICLENVLVEDWETSKTEGMFDFVAKDDLRRSFALTNIQSQLN